jgi:oligopeptide transport system substrate-binding protein
MTAITERTLGPASDDIQDAEILLFNTEPARPLIPGDTIEWGGGRPLRLLYTGLVQYGYDDAVAANAMAESIETTDSKFFRITLKKGWTFHDGTPVTARSYVDAWNYVAYGPNKMGNRTYFSKIDGFADLNPEPLPGESEPPTPKTDKLSGLTLVNDHEFTVTLSERASVFPTMLGYFAFYPMPESFFADPTAFARRPIGNGPYMFVSHTPEIETRFTVFRDYQGKHRGHVKDVTFRAYTNDDEGAYQDLVDGNLDYMEGLPYERVSAGDHTGDLDGRYVDRNFMHLQNLYFPHYLPGYDNPDLHKAISMAIDREKVIREAMNGKQRPADGFCVPGVLGYLPGQGGEYFSYHPEKAREHLKKSGFTGPLTLFANFGSAAVTWMPTVCKMISETLGIECTMNRDMPFGEYLKNVVGQTMTGPYRQDWRAEYPSLENFLSPLFKTGMAANYAGYSNPEFDAAIDAADAAPNEKAALQLYQRAERILVADMPAIPLWQEWSVSGYSRKLRNVKVDIFTDLIVTEVRVADDAT